MKDSSNCLVSSQYLADLVAPSPAILKPYTQSRRQSRRTKVGRIQSDKYSSLGKFVSKNPEVAQQSLQDYSHVSDLAKDLGSKVVVACYCLCSLLSPAASHAVGAYHLPASVCNSMECKCFSFLEAFLMVVLPRQTCQNSSKTSEISFRMLEMSF